MQGVEPQLSTVTRSLLYSIAHNALPNAFRHSDAESVTNSLDFAADARRMSESDDGSGLPDDHAGRGHGFRNMRANAARMGGSLEVASNGNGTTVSCAVPYKQVQGGRRVLSESRIRVMIVDDHAIVREGIAEVLEQSGEFEVVGQAGDGAEAVDKVGELRPDVVIMDILMPGMDGIEACREIVGALSETRVLMLTASNRHEAIVQAVNAGATGYLQKFSGKEMLLSTLREVAEGEFRVQGEAARKLVTEMGSEYGPIPPNELERLTAREREILKMFARGMSYAEIAEARGNSNPMSVRNSIYAIRRKLGVGSRQEMGVWAARSGLLDDDELL